MKASYGTAAARSGVSTFAATAALTAGASDSSSIAWWSGWLPVEPVTNTLSMVHDAGVPGWLTFVMCGVVVRFVFLPLTYYSLRLGRRLGQCSLHFHAAAERYAAGLRSRGVDPRVDANSSSVLTSSASAAAVPISRTPTVPRLVLPDRTQQNRAAAATSTGRLDPTTPVVPAMTTGSPRQLLWRFIKDGYSVCARYSCHPQKFLGPIALQMYVFMTVSVACRQLSIVDPEATADAVLWLTNLAEPDPLFILPAMTTALFYSSIHIIKAPIMNSVDKKGKGFAPHLLTREGFLLRFYGLAQGGVLLMSLLFSNFPAGMHFYILPRVILSICQIFALRVPNFREAIGLGPVAPFPLDEYGRGAHAGAEVAGVRDDLEQISASSSPSRTHSQGHAVNRKSKKLKRRKNKKNKLYR